MWPPITLRGVEAILSGTTKMVKTVDAIATTIATFSTTSPTTSMVKRASVARTGWKA